MQRLETGAALLHILAVMLLLPFLCTSIWNNLQSVTKQKSALRRGAREYSRSLQQLSFPSVKYKMGKGLESFEAEGVMLFRAKLLEPKLPQLLNQQASCPLTPWNYSSTTTDGKLLSERALRSASLCSNASSGKALHTIGNIELDHLQERKVLTTAGYIQIKNTLLLENSGLIIAGGDVFIEEVKANQPAILKVLSHSGAITISRGYRDIEICAKASQGVYSYKPYIDLKDCHIRTSSIPVQLVQIDKESAK